ncbi:MAG: aldo/keto reductase [Rhodobacteraceae bacterium]|nr:aldo/keto reductase [Paracoccaceae bacterium]
MKTRPIGKSGIEASVVGLGTWAIGGWKWGGADDAESIRAIQASIDAGVSLIDTAPAYGMGHSETVVGQAMKGRRDKVVLATKCGLVWHVQQGAYKFHQQDKPVHRHLGKASVMYEVEESLRRLGTDYIDLYITHWQDDDTPIAETMEALELLKTQGKIRAIGASNTSTAHIAAYTAAGQLDAIQEGYSMVNREIEGTLLPVCATNNIATLSYSSLALGLLSGKMSAGRVFAGDDLRKDNPLFSAENRTKVAGLMAQIAPICAAHDATEAQVIIAWTLAQPGITFALCGARNAAQASENAAAGALELSADDIYAISAAGAQHLTGITG